MQKPYVSHAGYAGALTLLLGSVTLTYLSATKYMATATHKQLLLLMAITFIAMILYEYFTRTAYNKKCRPTNNKISFVPTNKHVLKSTFYRFMALFTPFYIAYFIVHNHFFFTQNPAFAITITFFTYALFVFIIFVPPYLFFTLKYKNSRHYEYNDYAILTMIGIKSLFCLLFCRNAKAFHKNRRVKKIFLVYLINFFFLSLMIRLFLQEFQGLEKHMGILWSQNYDGQHWYTQARNWYFICFHSIFIIDIGIAIVGYSFASRWLENRTKSVDFSALGWFVVLFCYPPFNQLISNNFIFYHSMDTHELITSQIAWSVIFVILLLAYSVYVWATVALGFKFSNLTNRGIISHGPYKYIRHPAYTAKNIAWFTDTTYVLTNIWASLAFFIWSSIYIMRALTEEKHLEKDIEYRKYQKKVPYKFIPKII